MYFNSLPVHPQLVTNTGYQPVNEYYAPSSAYPNQGCSSDRPVSAREQAELLMQSGKDDLPEWKLAQFDGNPLNWHEWFGQFKSTVDSAVLTDDTKLTYLQTLVTGKAKTAIAEFSFSGVMYKDALVTLQRKFGQPHAIVGAHLDKLSTFPPLKMHNSENVISFSSAISGLVAVFKSLSFNDDLKSVNLLNQAVNKLPPNLKEAWSLHTVRHNWQRPTLLDFNNWLKEKAEGHERLRVLNCKAKNEKPAKRKTTKVFAANSQVISKAQDKSKFPPCVLCKGSHALWNCAVFKEKNATQRAKYVAEQKLCFACLNGNRSFRQCYRAKKCLKIAHIMSCSMEPKKYFLGGKFQMCQRRVEQTNPRRIQTLPPMPLLVIYMTLNHLKGCCQFQHLVYPRM